MALLARRSRRSAATKAAAAPAVAVELSIPAHFRCPISLDLMRDPVTAPTGITYDREGIEAWLDTGRAAVCPVTHAPLRHEDLVPNHAIRRVIQDWCVANRSRGVERIPTPRIPLTPVQASELLFDLADSSSSASASRPREAAAAIARVRALARDSERNRRCLASIGTGRVLAAALEPLAAADGATPAAALEDLLAALVCMTPLDDEAARILAAPGPLASLVAIAENGSLAGRLNAVLVIKEVVSCVDLTGNVVDEIVDALAKVIRAPICPQATKAAMVATYRLASSSERAAARAAGLVPVLVEALVGADRSAAEKALAVLDAVLASEEGRESARGHALAVPVLVKKMFRVSDLATELAVSAMWRLGRGTAESEGGEATGCLVEALRVGAFQKLLLLLQVGCRDGTKEKTTELLKMLNKHKGVGECVDAMDFRGINRLS